MKFFRILDLKGANVGRVVIADTGKGFAVVQGFHTPLILQEKFEGEPWEGSRATQTGSFETGVCETILQHV